MDATPRGVTCSVFLEGRVRGELTTHLSSTQEHERSKRSNDHWQGHMAPVARLTIPLCMHTERRHGMGDACARREYSATPLYIHRFH